jgi:hypothetical protein
MHPAGDGGDGLDALVSLELVQVQNGRESYTHQERMGKAQTTVVFEVQSEKGALLSE